MDRRIFVLKNDTLKLEIIRQCYDNPLAGHPGREQTYELIHRRYSWTGMCKYFERFIRNCDSCQKNKASWQSPYGLLQPLTPPTTPWSRLTMDHVGPLTMSNGYDSVLVVVDRLTKMAHYIPAKTTDTAEDLAV